MDLRKARIEADRVTGYILGSPEILVYYKLHFDMKFPLFFTHSPLEKMYLLISFFSMLFAVVPYSNWEAI